MSRALAAFLFLAACGTIPLTGKSPVRTGAQFVPDAGGLAVTDSALRVDFGRAPDGVIPVLDRELGRHDALPLSGCPAGVGQQLAWGDLTLTFTKERFVGWRNATGHAGQICAAMS